MQNICQKNYRTNLLKYIFNIIRDQLNCHKFTLEFVKFVKFYLLFKF